MYLLASLDSPEACVPIPGLILAAVLTSTVDNRLERACKIAVNSGCHTESANELCEYYRGARSMTAGRLRHSGHRLQVTNTLEQPVQRHNRLTTFSWSELRLPRTFFFLLFNCKIFIRHRLNLAKNSYL